MTTKTTTNRKASWEISWYTPDSKELKEALAEGWEPFAVVAETWQGPYEAYEQSVVYVRRAEVVEIADWRKAPEVDEAWRVWGRAKRAGYIVTVGTCPICGADVCDSPGGLTCNRGHSVAVPLPLKEGG